MHHKWKRRLAKFVGAGLCLTSGIATLIGILWAVLCAHPLVTAGLVVAVLSALYVILSEQS